MNTVRPVSRIPFRNPSLPAAAIRATTPWERYKACIVRERGSMSGKKDCCEEYREAISDEE